MTYSGLADVKLVSWWIQCNCDMIRMGRCAVVVMSCVNHTFPPVRTSILFTPQHHYFIHPNGLTCTTLCKSTIILICFWRSFNLRTDQSIQCTDQRMCYKTIKLKTPLILSIQLIKQNTNFYNHCFTSCAVFKCLQLHRTFDIKVHQGKWLQTAQSANCSVASVLATPLFLSVEQPALIKQLCY
jgi:hypothetical protein